MINFRRIGSEILVLTLALLGLVSVSAVKGAVSSGHLNGRVLDESGLPLSHLLISLSQMDSQQALPLLARTDEAGAILVRDMDPGTYRLAVKSARYRAPQRRLVKILPGHTTVVTLILQQLFELDGSGEENLGLKALFRNGEMRRLIFRNQAGSRQPAGLEAGGEDLMEGAIFEIHNHSGSGGDFLAAPGRAWRGTISNFAMVNRGVSGEERILAGQIRSSDGNSLLRFRNLMDYRLGRHHVVELTVGVSKMDFTSGDRDDLSSEGSRFPASEGEAIGRSASTLTLGVGHDLEFGRWMNLSWGWEMNQVRSSQNYFFVSPQAGVEITPAQGTSLQFLLASRRSTMANTVVTPEGRAVNLADAFQVSRIDGQLHVATSRYIVGKLRQSLGENTEIEVAAFDDQNSGAAVPVFAVLDVEPSSQALRLNDDQARSKGYRVSVERRLGEGMTARLSYLQGSASEFVSPVEILNLSQVSVSDILEQRGFRALSTELEAYLPNTRTQVTALIKLVAGSNPVSTIDALSDVYETSNEGVNLFIRQIVPLRMGLLNFLGLDFLAPERVEIILDLRNLLNQNLGSVQTSQGEAILVRNPRALSGGVSFRF